MPEPAAEPGDIGHAELRMVLDQELNRLPDKYRLPVILCDLEGRTRTEVADQLKLPGGTLSNRLAAARGLLAKRLSRRGFGCSVAALAAALPASAAALEMPAALLASTTQAVASLASSPIAAGTLISTQVADLVKGALQTMFWTKAKMSALVLVALGILGGGAVAFLSQEQNKLSGADPAGKTDVHATSGAGEPDQKRIQGTWRVIAMEEGGVAQPEKRFKSVNMRMVMSGTTFAIKTTTPDGRDVGPEGMSFSLDDKASPKRLDASKDGKTILGIYAFEKGLLKICIDLEGTIRPTGFNTQKGSQQRSYVLERKK